MSIESQYPQGQRNGKVFAGLVLLLIGCGLLLRQFTWFLIPGWVFSFPMAMIAFGIYLGVKHNNFLKPAPLLFLIFGVLNLTDDIIPAIDVSRAFWPLMTIVVGFWIITGRNKPWKNKENYNGNPFGKHDFTNPFEPKGKDDPNFDPNGPAADQSTSGTVPPYSPYGGDDVIDTVSVFGGVKRTILSKNFRGGDIVNIFGGTDLDLTQSDINGRVVIEIVQLFGGVKLIIPPHWMVVSDVAAVFSSVDDKRRSMGAPLSPDKVLVIKGVSIFAGVDIRSF